MALYFLQVRLIRNLGIPYENYCLPHRANRLNQNLSNLACHMIYRNQALSSLGHRYRNGLSDVA